MMPVIVGFSCLSDGELGVGVGERLVGVVVVIREDEDSRRDRKESSPI